MERVWIDGVPFDNVTMAETVAQVLELTRERGHAAYVCTGNLDHLALLHRDAEFREIYRSADLVLADGMPVVWLSRLTPGGPLRERVAGSDLFWELARESDARGLRLFFLGGAPGAAAQAAAAARKRYPNVKVCGIYCPPFETFNAKTEQDRIRDAVCRATPDVLMVALGAPKQEKWIFANKDLLGVPLSIGVGGSFEMAAGQVRRAPCWMQRTGTEWLYRLIQEPGRMWRRYLGRDLPFLLWLVCHTLAERRGRASAAGSAQPDRAPAARNG